MNSELYLLTSELYFLLCFNLIFGLIRMALNNDFVVNTLWLFTLDMSMFVFCCGLKTGKNSDTVLVTQYDINLRVSDKNIELYHSWNCNVWGLNPTYGSCCINSYAQHGNIYANLPGQSSISGPIFLHWAAATLKGLVQFQKEKILDHFSSNF